ncbi:Ig-like domain-containing protein [Rhodoferax sp.]|uniref:Ig-like domain-containing protein n=1 Tax=Rhodoferax sp. TaxID=50421 RepID=UPI00276820EA|nr:Ig-like domain-containing protein [Rhodoferax sp.]
MVPAFAQAPTAPQAEGRLLYTGASDRVSVGIANGGHIQGEWLSVLREQADSAWLGEAWFSRSAGGVQLNHHRQVDNSVRKYFVAIDQNQAHDRKLTLGAGLEQAAWFGNVSVSHALTGRRLAGQNSVTSVTQQAGAQDGRPFLDTLTRVSTTRVFERAYDYGLGLRAGHYHGGSDLRLTAGVDLEWGRGDARQGNLSFAAEKFFVGTPHSIALQFDHYRKQGEAEVQRNDTRVLLSYRYSFGAASTQPERLFRMVASPRVVAQPTVIPARTEHKLIKTKAVMTGDAFFALASATLSDMARAELDRIVALLKSSNRDGNVRIVGHTCDLGSDRFNNRLSLKRAEAVRDYLVAAGALPAEVVIVESKGKTEPKYPVSPATRDKNRRVDLEFFSVVEKTEVLEIPGRTIPAPETPVTYQRETVEQEPAWLRRALRVPAVHKRAVDVYRSQEVSHADSTSRVWLNRAPQAQADVYSVVGGTTTTLPVLDNDSDADSGDVLSIESVGSAARGQVRIAGAHLVYVAPLGFVGQDQFDYVVRDGHGGTATARVTVNVTVPAPAPVTQPNQAPVARDDFYVVSGVDATTLPVLANDADPDGDPLTIIAVSQPVDGNGVVTIIGSQVLFTPVRRFVWDNFTYTVSDGRGGQSTATVLLMDP